MTGFTKKQEMRLNVTALKIQRIADDFSLRLTPSKKNTNGGGRNFAGGIISSPTKNSSALASCGGSGKSSCLSSPKKK